MREVRLDGTYAHEERGGDLLVREPLHREVDDAALAGRQLAVRRPPSADAVELGSRLPGPTLRTAVLEHDCRLLQRRARSGPPPRSTSAPAEGKERPGVIEAKPELLVRACRLQEPGRGVLDLPSGRDVDECLAAHSRGKSPRVVLRTRELVETGRDRARFLLLADPDERLDEVHSHRERARVVHTLSARVFPDRAEAFGRARGPAGEQLGDPAGPQRLQPVPLHHRVLRARDRLRRMVLCQARQASDGGQDRLKAWVVRAGADRGPLEPLIQFVQVPGGLRALARAQGELTELMANAVGRPLFAPLVGDRQQVREQRAGGGYVPAERQADAGQPLEALGYPDPVLNAARAPGQVVDRLSLQDPRPTERLHECCLAASCGKPQRFERPLFCELETLQLDDSLVRGQLGENACAHQRIGPALGQRLLQMRLGLSDARRSDAQQEMCLGAGRRRTVAPTALP